MIRNRSRSYVNWTSRGMVLLYFVRLSRVACGRYWDPGWLWGHGRPYRPKGRPLAL